MVYNELKRIHTEQFCHKENFINLHLLPHTNYIYHQHLKIPYIAYYNSRTYLIYEKYNVLGGIRLRDLSRHNPTLYDLSKWKSPLRQSAEDRNEPPTIFVTLSGGVYESNTTRIEISKDVNIYCLHVKLF